MYSDILIMTGGCWQLLLFPGVPAARAWAAPKLDSLALIEFDEAEKRKVGFTISQHTVHSV
jgi:hypothetical protein